MLAILVTTKLHVILNICKMKIILTIFDTETTEKFKSH